MNSNRPPFRTQWIHRDPEPEPASVSSAMERAQRLPLPGPGLIITVPLSCLTEYMALHHLQAAGLREPKVQPKDGPGEGILLVRRIPNETHDKQV